MFNNFSTEKRAVCEIMLKNKVQPDRPYGNIIRQWKVSLCYRDN